MQDILADTSIWLTVSFAIFAWILWSKGKSALLSSIDSYIATVRQEIGAAKSLKAEAQGLMQEFEAKHRDSVKEAEEILALARKQVAQIQEQAAKDMAEASARREKQLAQRLERMKQAAMTEIQNYAADLAIKATREIIIEKLDSREHKRLVEAAVKDVTRHIN